MKEDGRKDAFSGVVIEPNNQDPQPNRGEKLPCYPCWSIGLKLRYDMPNRPHRPQNQAGCECAPPLLHGISDISRPAHLFTDSGDKEHHKKYRYQQKGNGRFGQWSPQEKHYSIREQQDKRVQENDGHIPDLLLDSLMIENSLQ